MSYHMIYLFYFFSNYTVQFKKEIIKNSNFDHKLLKEIKTLLIKLFSSLRNKNYRYIAKSQAENSSLDSDQFYFRMK